MIPSGPGRSRPLGGVPGQPLGSGAPFVPDPATDDLPDAMVQEQHEEQPAPTLPEGMSREEAYFAAFRRYVRENEHMPNPRQFSLYLMDLYGVQGRNGGPLNEGSLKKYLNEFPHRYEEEFDAEHIA